MSAVTTKKPDPRVVAWRDFRAFCRWLSADSVLMPPLKDGLPNRDATTRDSLVKINHWSDIEVDDIPRLAALTDGFGRFIADSDDASVITAWQHGNVAWQIDGAPCEEAVHFVKLRAGVFNTEYEETSRDGIVEPRGMMPELAALSDAFERRQAGLAPVAANDNKSNTSPFRVVDPTEWHGQPVPDREWFLPGLVPARNVTLLSGDGGVGKSLLALQIGAAAALGTQTLGLQPSGQRVFYLGAEDEEDEFHRRLAQIVIVQGRTLADLQGRFRLAPMAGEDATLMLPDNRKNLLPTAVMAALIDEVASFTPDLLILDTSADLFGGDEINRVQVRQFVGALRKIAMTFDCAIILLAHPSVQGMQSGSGLSGSTAWNNSVRSRLYLTAVPDDDAARVLTTVKSNYGKKGDGLKLRWHNGSFTVDDGKPGAGSAMMAAKAERVFLEILSTLNRQGRNVCHVPGTTYAPAVMAKMPEADGVPKDRLVNAMNALLRTGEIKIVKHGSASRERQKLIVSSEDFGPNDE